MFVVIEGLDGAGKSTQLKKIREYFAQKGLECKNVHFPRFDAPIYGELIAKFLRGELGDLNNVDPYLVALLYAGDRAEAKNTIEKWLKEDNVVVLDRYLYSNIAYQCAKVATKKEQEDLRNWIFDLEYNHNKIPKPDLSIFLNVPKSFTKSKLEKAREGDDRDYLKGKIDIHEASLSFQDKVREVYLEQEKLDSSFNVIDCGDEDGDMLCSETIFEKIVEKIENIK
ncbi:MAG: dTMP kinase [Bacteroidetes bacterium]|nr:dTMP kinase [Bacteroidota bacterium]